MIVIANGNLTIHKGKILRTHSAILCLVRASTCVLRLIRAYRNYGYGRTSATATGVPRRRLQAYYDCSYGGTHERTTLPFLLRVLYDIIRQ